jgi:hypothetical protein
MSQPFLLKSACALAALSTILTFGYAAEARNKGHRFLGTVHGGAATEAGAGATAELRFLDDICIGGSFDGGLNLVGTYADYKYFAPAVHGSYRIGLGSALELRPFFGARFPLGVEVSEEGAKHRISDHAAVAFTAALRLSYIYDIFVFGVQGDFTPHVVTWQDLTTTNTVDKTEYIVRASLVFGVALGPFEE